MRARLPEYIHELLDNGELAEVTRHLDRCPDCARAHARLVKGFRALDCWEVPGPRGDGFARFQETLRQGPAAGREPRVRGRVPQAVGAWPRWVRFSLTWGGFATACLLVGCLLFPRWYEAYTESVVSQNRDQITALTSQGRLPEAVATCRDWVAEGPDRKTARMTLAALESERSRYARLEGHLKRAVRANPTASVERLRLGDTLRIQGKLPEAREQYLKAVALDEYCLEGYLKLARVAEARNLPAEARSHLDMAMRLAPDDIRVSALASRLSGVGGGAAETAARFRQAAEDPNPSREGLFDMAVRLRR